MIFHQFFLAIISVFIYLKGYLPMNQNDLEVVKPPNHILDYKLNVSYLYKPKIERLIFVIIDALREDFVTFDNMPYTYQENDRILKVKVEAPTVTLPRIKALTTGGIPQFVDIILNLGATTKCDDSFLDRAKAAGKNMIFYGDDTWIRMYPDLFVRMDGTTSFFVNDFKEVDDNVTRHLDEEMLNDDWDIMFLHYLGLDHIGHVKGPFSPLIKPKLREMDVVIQQLVESSKSWDKETLVLVTGDHGMKDSGGHGGTTYAETHVPLVVFGNFTSKSNEPISQTDIPTTLSTLFAIEIPPSSIGKTIQYFVKDYELDEKLYILYYNLLVLRRNSNICEENFVKATQMHKEYLKHFDPEKGKQIYDLYYGCIKTISENLIQSSVQQNTVFLIFSMVLSINCLILIATKVNAYNVYLYLILLIFFLSSNTSFYYIPLICAIIATIKSVKFHSYNLTLSIPIVLHAVLLQSSSFIEEEHQIYLFFTCTVSLILSYLSLKTSIVTSLIPLLIISSFRFLRKINSTGDMWASYPDFSDWLLREENFNYYQIFFAASLILNLIILSYFYKPKVLQSCFFAITFFAIFVFKMHFTNDPQLGKFIWFIIGLSSIALKGNLFKRLITIWVLIITLLLRPYNILLIPACILISAIAVNRVQSIDILTLIHSWLGFSLFFCQGHSNSIASIDLAPAYIGLESYIPFIVFTITMCHTYAFQILSILLLMNEKKYEIDNILQTNVIYRLVILITIYSVTFIQRGHLFVWSVFAPKLLIESVHALVLFFIYCIVIVLQKIIFNKL